MQPSTRVMKTMKRKWVSFALVMTLPGAMIWSTRRIENELLMLRENNKLVSDTAATNTSEESTRITASSISTITNHTTIDVITAITAHATTNEAMPDMEIPFYLYPFSSLHWLYVSCNQSNGSPKHDHAYFAWRAMLRHPWRTDNQSHAKLAILPAEFDVFHRKQCGTTDPDLVVQEIKSVVNKNPVLFPRVRHLVIMNDWRSRPRWSPVLKAVEEALYPTSIIAKMEQYDKKFAYPKDCSFGLGFTSNYATTFAGYRQLDSVDMPRALVFGKQRKYSVHMVGLIGKCKGRNGFRHRNMLFLSHGDIPNAFIVSSWGSAADETFREWIVQRKIRWCDNNKTNASDFKALMTDPTTPVGDFDRCLLPSLDRVTSQKTQELSNYTLLLRGDSMGSDRWINAMTAGTALIVVIESEQDFDWLPFPNIIPWHDFVINITMAEWGGGPDKAIRRVLDTTSEERLLELQQLSLKYAADLDWTAHGSRTVENVLRTAAHTPCHRMPSINATSG